MSDCPSCRPVPCPAPVTVHSEAVGEHWWSGWPGAFCLKCHAEDPREMCLADGCACACHREEE